MVTIWISPRELEPGELKLVIEKIIEAKPEFLPFPKIIRWLLLAGRFEWGGLRTYVNASMEEIKAVLRERRGEQAQEAAGEGKIVA